MSDEDILKVIFHQLEHGLTNTGFFFGAGTSVVAGYPTTPELTVQVFDKLPEGIISIIENILIKAGSNLPDIAGIPNIETIADILQDYLLHISDPDEQTRIKECIDKLREGIIQIIGEVTKPNLSSHIKFLEALLRIYSGKSQPVWIFTTNYDLCFEMAAAQAGINLVDGFLGSEVRYFAHDSLFYQLGTQTQGSNPKFARWETPTIKLVKLHGSLDWWSVGSKIFSCSNEAYLSEAGRRAIVLPQKMKQGETLSAPYSRLFDVASHVLGTECKYLVSCGFRFGDEHINSRLFLPKLKTSHIKLTALLRQEHEGLLELAKNPSVTLLTDSSIVKSGKKQQYRCDLWDFSKLADTLNEYSGR